MNDFGDRLDQLEVGTEQCAFVDDTPANVAAGATLGMRGHLYRTPQDLATFPTALPLP